MRIQAVDPTHFEFNGHEACLVLPDFEEGPVLAHALLAETDAATLAALHEKKVIAGKAQDCYYLATPSSPYVGVLVLGLGKQNAANTETLRRAAGKACPILAANRIARVVYNAATAPDLDPAGLVEGLVLGQYRFDQYKEKKEDQPAPAVVEETTILSMTPEDAAASCMRASRACENANWARDLANTPANALTPAILADKARAMAQEVGCSCEILDEDAMAALGMNALLGVSRGSAEPARLIVLHYEHGKDAETVALVGKGITFDTGGISIKPSEGMHEMKYDMCGAAAVLGAFKTLAEEKPAINIVCVVPSAENVPGASAQKPGDIVTACNGKTIEVNNTDAEGRLILADALAYTIDRWKPSKCIDAATLTGACIVALGHYAAGVMGTDEALIESLKDAGEAVGERVWPFPLWDDYDRLVEGTHADLCNIGPAREAGTIMGGCFLKAFVGDTPWMHLDIAGTAWGPKNISYLDAKSATGYGVRLLAQWVQGLVAAEG